MQTIGILPAFNEEPQIRDVVDNTVNKVDKLLVINDGSVDSTGSVLEKLKKDYSKLSVIHIPINSGKSFAIRHALHFVTRKFRNNDKVVFLDADNDHNPTEIDKIMDSIGNHDFVIGNRYSDEIYDNHRKTCLSLVRTITANLTGYKLSDPCCGFRATTIEFCHQMLRNITHGGFSIEMEELVSCSIHDRQVSQVDLKHHVKQNSFTKRKEILDILIMLENYIITSDKFSSNDKHSFHFFTQNIEKRNNFILKFDQIYHQPILCRYMSHNDCYQIISTNSDELVKNFE